MRPNYLGTADDFKNRFEAPILNGQCIDSTPEDVALMKRRAFVLAEKLRGFVNRQDYSTVVLGENTMLLAVSY